MGISEAGMLCTSTILQMNWDPEALTDRANEAMSTSSSRNPLEFNWGLFAWGDAPPACGGGVGAFQWFDELSTVLSFITDLSPAGFATFDEEAEWLELRDQLRQIANGFAADSAATISAFNDNLKSLLQIEWIGPLEELLSGHGSFPCLIRARFHDDWDDDASPESMDAISASERESFLEFLAEYGI